MNMSYDELDELDDDSIDDTYLTFQVGKEEYAVAVAHVTEIVRLQKCHSVPDVPAHVRGVINLRGKVIPLIDVRTLFGLAGAEYTDRTVVVVLEVGETSTGLVVDSVTEVAEIPKSAVDAGVPKSSGRGRMLRGMGKRDERISFILDVPQIVDPEARA